MRQVGYLQRFMKTVKQSHVFLCGQRDRCHGGNKCFSQLCQHSYQGQCFGKKIVSTVSWSVGEAPRLVPLLNTAQRTKSMNIIMLRRGMVFNVRLLFCLTAHIAHANYVAKCTAASCLLPFIVQNRVLVYGAHPVFNAKCKEKVPVYLDKCVGLV